MDPAMTQLHVLGMLLVGLAISSLPLGETSHGAKLQKSGACSQMTSDNTLAVTSSHSLLECAAWCRQNPRCDVIKFCAGSGNSCVMSSKDVRSPIPESAVSASCRCLEKRCLHGGVEQQNGSCRCVDGYVGTRCEQLTSDCKELLQVNSSAIRNVYLFLPSTAPRPFPLLCGSSGGAIVARRFLNNEDFNRSWDDYAAGFGSHEVWSSRDTWTGLRSWRYLTSNKDFILQVYLYVENGTNFQTNYYDFKMGEEANGFPITYDSSGGPLGNSLAEAAFSTYDRDQDTSPSKHCAQLHGGGWWFTDCGDSNPTGPLNRPSNARRQGIPAEAFWTYNLGNLAVWKVMMVLYI